MMRSVFTITAPLIAAAVLFSAGAVRADDRADHGGMMRQKAPAGAKVMIESPKDGATVGQDVLVKFAVSGIEIKPAGDPTPNAGHHHLLIDVKDLPPGNAPIPNDATHKHYGKGQTEDTIHLEPGKHTLQLDFGDTKHMQFDPPLVSKKITINVK